MQACQQMGGIENVVWCTEARILEAGETLRRFWLCLDVIHIDALFLRTRCTLHPCATSNPVSHIEYLTGHE